MLFQCYELVRDDQDMAHASIQPIIQISSLNGPIFKDDDSENGGTQARLEFLNNFLQCFLNTFSKYILTLLLLLRTFTYPKYMRSLT